MGQSLHLVPYMYNLQVLQLPNKKDTITIFTDEEVELLKVYPGYGSNRIPVQVCFFLPQMKNWYDERWINSHGIQ